MIDFSCHCGHAFSVGDELAGGLVQCPKCRRLNDVPRLGDLKDLDDQGIYKIDAPPTQCDQHRVSEMATAFTREHFDENGQPFDLRETFADPKTGPIPLESLGPRESAPPKYDPITGELIESIEVKADAPPNPATLPVARRAVLPPPHAIDGIEIPAPAEAMKIPFRLLRPMNFAVMVFVFLALLVGQGMMAAMGARYLILWPFWMALHAVIIAHYANVIDETGPCSKNELPAPMRHLEWHEDTFGSFVRFTVALAMCYGPSMLVMKYYSIPAAQQIILILSSCLALLGTALFPAALLTTTTSGSSLNLRPDRLVAVVMICGAEYVVTVITWTIAAGLSVWGILLTCWYSYDLLAVGNLQSGTAPTTQATAAEWLIAESAVIGGIYFMHIFTWHLGILYRKHHQRFPWLYQRHDRARGGIPQAKGFPVRRARHPAPAPPPDKSVPRVQPITTQQKPR